MSESNRSETSSVTTGPRKNRRPRNEKVKSIATKSAARSAEQEDEIWDLRETVRELQVENGVLKSKLASAQETICHLASGQHLRPAYAEATPSPHHQPERLVVAVPAPGLNVAARAWHQPQQERQRTRTATLGQGAEALRRLAHPRSGR